MLKDIEHNPPENLLLMMVPIVANVTPNIARRILIPPNGGFLTWGSPDSRMVYSGTSYQNRMIQGYPHLKKRNLYMNET